MEHLDQELAEALRDRAPESGPGRLLIVAGTETVGTGLQKSLTRSGHRCRRVASLSAAGGHLDRHPVDVVLVDPRVTNGEGLDFVQRLASERPVIKTIVLDPGTPDFAMQAMRAGATDVLTLPVDEAELLDRVDAAVTASRRERHRDELISRLRDICHELNVARHDIARQVDMLCNDLAAAYKSVTQQVDDVAITSEFRTLLQQDLDVEELLRTTLEYLLAKVGPTNAAVFLPDADQVYGLGAYVNYNCPRDAIDVLLDHLCRAICPQMAAETDVVCFEDADDFAQWVGVEADIISGSQVIAYSCRHNGRCLAVVVMFRPRSEPFGEELMEIIDLLRPIFAEQLAHAIRIHHRASPSWPDDDGQDDELDLSDDYGFGLAA